MLKKLIFAASFFISSNLLFSQEALKEFNTNFDKLLTTYVSGNGEVDYVNLSKDESFSSAKKNVDLVKKEDLTSDVQEKTFLINAYNFLVIAKVVENYPTSSPKNIDGFFEKKDQQLFGKKRSLTEIEKDLLFKNHFDARLHFVLVCAAKGCPALLNKIYTKEELEQQLASVTKKTVNGGELVKVVDNNNVKLSEIFKWYKADFLKEAKSLPAYINTYLTTPISSDANVTHFTYDWTLNSSAEVSTAEKMSGAVNNNSPSTTSMQTFAPSKLLRKGGWEFKIFNALYTQTKNHNLKNVLGNADQRSTFFTSINQFLIGVSPNLNVGFDVWIKSSVVNELSDSPLEALKFENTLTSRWAVSGIGPKVKLQPVKAWKNISLQSTFLFPSAKNQEGGENSPYLSSDTYLWITQIMYDKIIAEDFQIFAQISPWVYAYTDKEREDFGYVSAPATLFLSYFPNQRLTTYFQAEFWPNFGTPFIQTHFTQLGIGGKYQIIPDLLEIEASHTNFILGKNTGAGKTFNVGFRLIGL